MLSMNTTTAFRRDEEQVNTTQSGWVMFRPQQPVPSFLYLSFLFQAFKKPVINVWLKKSKSKVPFLFSTMNSNSGQIQMTADADDIQAKSIYHGAKKNPLFLSLLRLGGLKVLDSSASVKSQESCFPHWEANLAKHCFITKSPKILTWPGLCMFRLWY